MRIDNLEIALLKSYIDDNFDIKKTYNVLKQIREEENKEISVMELVDLLEKI